jgi:hypothetical protein
LGGSGGVNMMGKKEKRDSNENNKIKVGRGIKEEEREMVEAIRIWGKR